MTEAFKKINNNKMKKILANSINYAIENSHKYVSSEHILLCCLDDEDVKKIIHEWLKKDKEETLYPMKEFLKNVIEKTVPKESINTVPELASSTAKAIADTIIEIFESNKYKSIEPWHIFYHFIMKRESDYFCDFILKNYLTDPSSLDEVIKRVEDGLQKRSKESFEETEKKEILNIIEEMTEDMVKKAEEYDPLIGRQKEIFFIQKTLCRRLKNNVIIVGHPGVGKTAIVEGLAKKIKNGDVPEKLKNARIYSLTVSNMIAGTKYRGDFEEKIKILFESFEKMHDSNFALPIIFIDEIHMVIGAGTSSENKNIDFANILKPYLTKGKLRFIGATTYEEYHRHIEKDNALKRRFQALKINEPSPEEAKEIIKGIIDKFEKYHNVSYTDKAIDTAVNYSIKHITKKYLPDKAIDIIDIAGARKNIINADSSLIDEDEIISEISETTNIPKEKLKEKKQNNVILLEENLKKHIYGQDHVIEEVVNTIFVSRAGLKENMKPDGIFLFNGPTGTGKTELAKVLANSLDMGFYRIDMSEFMEQHSVSKLIGPPPGYVGYEQTEGILYNISEENPFSVILLDEIEKAHPSVWNIFLQIFDYGKISTSKGKDVFFGNSIFIMTGNIGSSFVNKREIGFGRETKGEEFQSEELKRIFPPELLNRIDAVVTFRSLSKETCYKIIDKFIHELENKLIDKNINIEIDEKAKKYLLTKGFDSEMGARPLKRIIDKEIKKTIAKEIITNKDDIKKIVISYDNEIKCKCE